jgi:hypothetical protein
MIAAVRRRVWTCFSCLLWLMASLFVIAAEPEAAHPGPDHVRGHRHPIAAIEASLWFRSGNRSAANCAH